jgi:hypothetical protein
MVSEVTFKVNIIKISIIFSNRSQPYYYQLRKLPPNNCAIDYDLFILYYSNLVVADAADRDTNALAWLLFQRNAMVKDVGRREVDRRKVAEMS